MIFERVQTAAKTTRNCAWAVVCYVSMSELLSHQAVSDIDVE